MSYLFPQDKVVHTEKGIETIREGGATMLDFFTFAYIASGYDAKEAFQFAEEALEVRKKYG